MRNCTPTEYVCAKDLRSEGFTLRPVKKHLRLSITRPATFFFGASKVEDRNQPPECGWVVSLHQSMPHN